MLMKIALCILSSILLNKDKSLLRENWVCFAESDACLIYPFNHLRRELCQNKGKIFAVLETEHHNISTVCWHVYLDSLNVCTI